MITPRRLDEISNAAQGATIDLIESDNFAIALCTHLEETYFADEEEEEGAGWNEGVSTACDSLFVEATKRVLESLTPSDLAALAEPMGLVVMPVTPSDPMVIVGVESMALSYPEHIEPTSAVLTAQPKDIYNAMVEAGRIKPKQAERKDDE